MRVNTILVFLFVVSNLAIGQKRATIGKKNDNKEIHIVTGHVKDISNGEGLVGATIYVPSLSKGVNTELDGSYSIELKKGEYAITYSMVGFEEQKYIIEVIGDGKLNVKLIESSLQLDEIRITSESPDQNIKNTDIGKQVLTIQSIQELPAFVGEVDIIKSLTLLPGVSTVGEASSGFHVRGGSSAQNLILLGGATLYNPSHLFGFFSSFNADVISDVTLYKGGIPAKYGGRGSSVLDIKYKNGDLNNWKGKGSIGLISTKATLEGPIIENKMSLVIGGRVSYSDWILKSVKDPDVKNSSASFYDLNGRLSYIINDKNKVAYSYYRSGDDFSFASDTSLYWSNSNHVLEWNHSNGDKLSYQLQAVKNRYEYSIFDHGSINQFDLDSHIENYSLSFNSDIKIYGNNFFSFGGQSQLLEINPGEFRINSPESTLNDKTLQLERSLESAIFADYKWEINDNISLSAGLRYSMFDYLGERVVYDYELYVPKSDDTILDSLFYGDNDPIVSYNGYEPRVSLRWSLNNSTSIKAGYNKVYQYIHLISNTSTIAPTDIWKLSDTYLKPEIVSQYSIGLFKNFKNNSIETSVEAYYKETDNLVEYKGGAQLILKDNLETELLNGIGKAYGLELYLRKKTGKVTGWVSYTYSRSLVQVEGAYDVEQINNGDWYSSNFDKPHDFTAVMVYKINRNWSMSSNFTFSTGRPTTYPTDKFNYSGHVLGYFENRNETRVPNYHRLDFSITYKSPSRRKVFGGDWILSIYNVYGRKNAFSVFFRDKEGSPPQPYKLSVLGIPFPSLTYNFKF